LIQKTIKTHNSRATVIRRLEKFKHAFTHYNLCITPIIVSSPGGKKNYYKTNALLKGVPAPVKKIIQSL
jgi:adenine-specific DNA glycosylase